MEAEPEYDAHAIARHLDLIEKRNRAWDQWFLRQGIEPLSLEYQTVVEQPAETVQRVADAVGTDVTVDAAVQSPTQRQADVINAEWIARFRAGR